MLHEPLSAEIVQASDLLAQQQQLTSTPKMFEALIYGPGCKEHISAKICRIYSKKTVAVDHTSYFYQINCSVKQGQEYQLYLPRFF